MSREQQAGSSARWVWRVLLVLVTAVGVGWGVDRVVLARAAVSGAYQAQVRLGAATAGLFAGGAAATVMGIALMLRRKS